MTESELLANEDFLAFCAKWEEDKWCPLPFADWCADRDFTPGFEACVWAHHTECRRVWEEGKMETRVSRVYPHKGHCSESRWSMSRIGGGWGKPYADDVPLDATFPESAASFQSAIAYYLTHFSPEIAAKYPPKAVS